CRQSLQRSRRRRPRSPSRDATLDGYRALERPRGPLGLVMQDQVVLIRAGLDAERQGAPNVDDDRRAVERKRSSLGGQQMKIHLDAVIPDVAQLRETYPDSFI